MATNEGIESTHAAVGALGMDDAAEGRTQTQKRSKTLSF